jgi:hypothetical protein
MNLRRFAAVTASLAMTIMCTAGAARSAPPAHAAHPAKASPLPKVEVVQLPGGASVVTGAGASVAELGAVSYSQRRIVPGVMIQHRPASYVVTTAIGLRATSATTSSPVSLQAFLDSPVSGVVVRLDGIELSTNPATFATGMPLGVVTRHRLEVEIPNSLSPASIPHDIPLEFGATAQ